jgi:hypothetical protein
MGDMRNACSNLAERYEGLGALERLLGTLDDIKMDPK